MRNSLQADFSPFDASAWKVGIVVTQFNRHITDALKDGALKRARDYGLSKENVNVFAVAGAIEIPLVLQELAKTGAYDALLAIGCVIKGDTPHFDYVCRFVTDGILKVQLEQGMPIGMGVLTCNTEEQALARASLGGDHLDAVMHQARVIKEIRI